MPAESPVSNQVSLNLLREYPERVQGVIVLAPQEPLEIIYEWNDPKNYFDSAFIMKQTMEHDISLVIVSGAEHTGPPRHHNIKNVSWTTWFLSYTAYHTYLNRETATLDFTQPEQYKFPFVCMNRYPREHRIILVDRLFSKGILDKGAVSWHTNDMNHHYASWRPEFLHLTNDGCAMGGDLPGTTLQYNNYNLPKEFYESFIHLVTETSFGAFFLTEKTVMPMLRKKPFVVCSGPGFHAKLKSMGFELYDELIDYSFDKEPGLVVRSDMLADEMVKITQMSNNDMQAMYKVLKPKLEHNYNKAISLASDPAHIPPLVRELHFFEFFNGRNEAVRGVCNSILSKDAEKLWQVQK